MKEKINILIDRAFPLVDSVSPAEHCRNVAIDVGWLGLIAIILGG